MEVLPFRSGYKQVLNTRSLPCNLRCMEIVITKGAIQGCHKALLCQHCSYGVHARSSSSSTAPAETAGTPLVCYLSSAGTGVVLGGEGQVGGRTGGGRMVWEVVWPKEECGGGR